jgi:hypothetical protein
LTLRASVEDERGSDRELAAQDRGGHGRDAPTSWITLARVNIYPDAAHGFQFQHHADFARDVGAFLRE